MDTIPEANKRSSQPACSSTPPAAPSFSSTPAPAGTAACSGPALGDESWEDIADRTGAKITDVLGNKLAFKRGTRSEKKADDMWKSTCEQLEASLEDQKQAWETKEQDLRTQLTNLQVCTLLESS
eukprot:gene27620-7257_t